MISDYYDKMGGKQIIFLCTVKMKKKKSPEVNSAELLWELHGIIRPRLLSFCALLKVTSLHKVTAGAPVVEEFSQNSLQCNPGQFGFLCALPSPII